MNAVSCLYQLGYPGMLVLCRKEGSNLHCAPALVLSFMLRLSLRSCET